MQVLMFIDWYIKRNGYPPSRVEIASAISAAPNTANHYVAKLCKQGLLIKQAKVYRAIKVTNKGKRAISAWQKSHL